MASRRTDRDYRRYEDDDDDDRGVRRGERREPRRDTESRTSRVDPPRETKKPRTGLNEFFISNEGIHREVLQKEICRFLGPEAFSAPKKFNVCGYAFPHPELLLTYTQGVDGYMIRAVRPFTPVSLTQYE